MAAKTLVCVKIDILKKSMSCNECLEEIPKAKNITKDISKGVLSLKELMLGDSVLTVSHDKGIIYTEVG